MSFNVEHLSPRDSLFARFDARWKLAALLLAAGAVVTLRSPIANGAALVVAILLAAVARLPGDWFRLRIGSLLIALLPFLLILPLTVDHGGPSIQWLGLKFSADGLVPAAGLMSKTIAIVTLMLIVLASSPLQITLRAAQRLYMPSLLMQLTLLSYRYVFLLLDELNRLRIALRVRGFRNRANRHSYRTVGQVTGTLLVRGAERADRVAQAMRCRGFDGTFRGLDAFQTTKKDIVMFSIIVIVFVGIAVADWSI